jgi:hypothetical protein
MTAANAGLKGQMPEKKVTATRVSQKKVGPNDLCPCGSGKKYKKCCGSVMGAKTEEEIFLNKYKKCNLGEFIQIALM